MKEKNKILCSLDIETSGFDPLKDEILEVGFVFFEISSKGIKITEEYSQVFKPVREVPAKIFGLTGISQRELDEAPKFSEQRDFIQDKLKDAVIVGHNVIFDIKFLESVGIKFSGEIIDTLDLVQFILPTHHSYNLENLMHTFSILHKDAHRALADCKAALQLLEKLLQIYSSFPQKLKNQIQTLTKPLNLPAYELLNFNLPERPGKASPTVIPTKSKSVSPDSLKIEAKSLYNFPLGLDYLDILLSSLAKAKTKVLLVLPKAQQVLELWRGGKAKGVFASEQLFDEVKLQSFLDKKDLTLDEIKFLLKVLVWKYTNWQSECLADLNLSFFGGQFRQVLSGAKTNEDPKSKILCCDQKTFLSFSKKALYSSRLVVVLGLPELEQNISSNIAQKVSWGYISYILKSFYNPEITDGNSNYKDAVLSALSASDLFFGLVSALLNNDSQSFQNFAITEETQYSENYQKIKQAAENYADKLVAINQILKSESVDEFAENLKSFFRPQQNRVKWIELSESRCVFHSSPISIHELVAKTLLPYKKIAFADCLGAKEIINYFIQRLGLNFLKIIPVENLFPDQGSSAAQPDLFSKTVSKKHNSLIPRSHLEAKVLSSEDLTTILEQGSLSAAVLFGSSSQVKEYYENNYSKLQTYAFLLTQNASGGSNKIFHNFAIHKNSLLLATDKFILKFLASENAVQPLQRLAVSTLIVGHLPFEQFTHPYQQALAAEYDNAFEEFSLPRALYNFHSLVRFFYTPSLKTIYLFDTKLSKPYAKVFKDYVKALSSTTF